MGMVVSVTQRAPSIASVPIPSRQRSGNLFNPVFLNGCRNRHQEKNDRSGRSIATCESFGRAREAILRTKRNEPCAVPQRVWLRPSDLWKVGLFYILILLSFRARWIRSAAISSAAQREVDVYSQSSIRRLSSVGLSSILELRSDLDQLSIALFP